MKIPNTRTSVKTHFEFAGLSIELTQKKIKCLSIRMCPPCGDIRVSAPLHYSREKIIRSLDPKLPWIIRHQQRFLKIRAAASEAKLSGNTLFFLQQQYAYEFFEHPKLRGPVLGTHGFTIYLKPGSGPSAKKWAIRKWHEEALRAHLHFFIQKWSLILSVQVSSFSIRAMKTKWGSCHVHDRKIVFNLELIQHSIQCIEYVVVHELIHLIEPSHNARFKRFMTETVPEWKKLKEDLNRNHLLMSQSARNSGNP